MANQFFLQPSFYDVERNDWGVFFWRAPGFMSNWTDSPFTFEGYSYNNAEQAIMHLKARAFKDDVVAKQIMDCKDPRKQRSLGRKVKDYDEDVWKKTLDDKLVNLLYQKYLQNPLFARALLETGDLLLFEASPLDKKWGTGVNPQKSVKEKRADTGKWGRNILGTTLEKVREILKILWLPHSRCNYIIPNVIIGAKPIPETIDNILYWLGPQGVIVNLTTENVVDGVVHVQDVVHISKVTTTNIPIQRGRPPRKQDVPIILDLIKSLPNDDNKRYYIHCEGGHGRAGMIGCLIVGKILDMDVAEAVSYVDERKKRERLDKSRNVIPTLETQSQVNFLKEHLGIKEGNILPDRTDKSWLKHKRKTQKST